MRTLIKKILKESFVNPDVDSTEHNICDVMSVNSWDEIDSLLSNMSYGEDITKKIEVIKAECESEVNNQSHDGDSFNFYLRKIQNILCR
jgi:hypothetical protein